MRSDVNGCSTCRAGEEKFEVFRFRSRRKSKSYVQYDYRTESGELFSTVAPTLEKARSSRDEWLNKTKKETE